MGHIINLSAQSFLFVTDEELIELVQEENPTAATLTELEVWRKKGCLGQLHNIVVWFQGNPQRMNRFLALSRGRRLARDNETRWNSWYNMIRVATTVPCKKAIIEYFELYSDDCPSDNLTDRDWQNLENIRDFLAKLSETTMALQGYLGTANLNSTLRGMEFIMEAYEQATVQFEDDPFLLPMLNSGWAKLKKYYDLSDAAPVHVAALILDPSLKWKYIDDHWNPEWIENARKSMQLLWDEYKPAAPTTNLLASTPRVDRQPNSFTVWMKQRIDKPSALDEYERYCTAPRVWQIDHPNQPWDWWLEPQQQRDYPNLARLAVDILSIPAMSDLVEKVFSSAKQTLVDRRSLLGSDALEATECTRSWLSIEDFNQKVGKMLGKI